MYPSSERKQVGKPSSFTRAIAASAPVAGWIMRPRAIGFGALATAALNPDSIPDLPCVAPYAAGITAALAAAFRKALLCTIASDEEISKTEGYQKKHAA